MIPKYLHHIWTGPAPLPTRFLHNLRSWRERHPNWEHFLWTDRRLPSLRLGNAFGRFTSEFVRHEIVRAEVLAQFGGLVADPSAECLAEFDDAMASGDAFMSIQADGRAVVAAHKRHPLVQFINRALLRWVSRSAELDDPQTFQSYVKEVYGVGSLAHGLQQTGLPSRLAWHDLEQTITDFRYEPESIVIAVRTVRRDASYVHQTLASIFAADPWVRRTGEVLVIVGNEHLDFLKNYFHHETIRVVPMTEAELARHSKLTRTQSRASLTQTRCYRIPLRNKMGIVMFEDDVICRENFLQRMLATVREMEQEHGLRDYALSMYSPYDFEAVGGTFISRRFCAYNAHPFVCTQGMYFPAHIAPMLGDAMERLSIENYEMAGDILVGEQLPGKIYATPRLLVQHTGDISTGQGGTTMDQTMFHRPYVLFDPANGDPPMLPCYPNPRPVNLVAPR